MVFRLYWLDSSPCAFPLGVNGVTNINRPIKGNNNIHEIGDEEIIERSNIMSFEGLRYAKNYPVLQIAFPS